MRFINKGEATQVRIEVEGEFQWILLWPGEEIDLPEQQGINYGFKRSLEAFQGKIGESKVETKVIAQNDAKTSQNKDSEDFLKEIIAINGIGTKTAKKIVKIYSKDELISALKNNINYLKSIFRDDMVNKLREIYGK